MRLHVVRERDGGVHSPGEHVVHYFSDSGALLASVVARFQQAAARGDAIVVCSNDERWFMFQEGLRQIGLDVDGEVGRGTIRRVEPHRMLSDILVDGMPDPRRFDACIGRMIRDASATVPSRSVFAYAEVIDLLWEEGRFDAASRLQELWTELSREVRLTFTFTQRVDIFRALLNGMPTRALVERPTISLFDTDRPRLQGALRKALEDVAGVGRAGSLLNFVATIEPPPGLPSGPEHALFWIRDNIRHCGLDLVRLVQWNFAGRPEGTRPPKCRIAGNDAPCRVLVVEDDPDDVFLMEYTFGRFARNLEIDVARDGESAWTRLTRDPVRPAHVLLDLKLPKKSGFELLEALKRNERLKDLPVTVHTSSREPRDVTLAYRLGAVGYVVKRAEMKELVSGLSTLCALRPESPGAREVA